MSSSTPSLDPFDSYEQWNPYDDISQQQIQTNDLKLRQFPDRDSEGIYDEDPQIYIHYSIVWKVIRNKRGSNGTRHVQDTVLSLIVYCHHLLNLKIDNYWLQKKTPDKFEDVTAMVSVT